MNFQPIVPIGGVAGFLFVERTREAQQEVFDRSPQLEREVAYFRENVATIGSAEELVADRTLLTVALGAFGLEDEIDKRYFLQKILEEGSEESDALANRLVDTRYREFAAAFGFGDLLGSRVQQSDFAERIVDAYKTRQFEVAVGNVDNSIRLSLNFEREIAGFLPETDAVDQAGTAWFRIMGNEPIRAVIQSALGIPDAVSALDIDRQREIFEDKATQIYGTSSVNLFQDPENVDRVIRDFLAREQIESGPSASTPGMSALTLLSSSGLGTASTANLLLSIG